MGFGVEGLSESAVCRLGFGVWCPRESVKISAAKAVAGQTHGGRGRVHNVLVGGRELDGDSHQELEPLGGAEGEVRKISVSSSMRCKHSPHVRGRAKAQHPLARRRGSRQPECEGASNQSMLRPCAVAKERACRVRGTGWTGCASGDEGGGAGREMMGNYEGWGGMRAHRHTRTHTPSPAFPLTMCW